MTGTQAAIPTSMTDPHSYPLEKRLIQRADRADEAVFMVDIGGSKGHDLMQVLNKHPDLPGALVLQDQAHVVAEATDLDPRIQTIAHDFLRPQPVVAARVYHLHRILLDWPDSVAYQIFIQIHVAMKPGYSKLLVNEIVMEEKGAHMPATGLDLIMMSIFSASRRTEAG